MYPYLPIEWFSQRLSADRDIRPTNFVGSTNFAGQVSIPANGEYAYLLAPGCNEGAGKKLETLLGLVSL